MADETKTNTAWKDILSEKPNIVRAVKEGGIARIRASEIKRFREPRLMTKFDTSASVPLPLRENNLNVLPVSRSEYVLGDFELYKQFPDVSDLKPKLRSLPDFETLKIDDITSESNAINALIVSDILNEFLETDATVETFNGRMGSGTFEFDVHREKHADPARIEVCGAQLEIDGGFENTDSVIIMEAKNIRHDDFHVRQLYYPFRKYDSVVNKPIRLIFSQYTNLTYYLFEYRFENPSDYSSITLVRKDAYTFDDTRITPSDLWQCLGETPVITDDNTDHTKIPFIQADRFDRVIALMERLKNEPEGLSTDDVAKFMGTTVRQAAYYPAAGKYLGLFDRTRGFTKLSKTGEAILKMSHRDRQLAFAGSMFRHRIFHDLFEQTYKSGTMPTKTEVITKMNTLHVCSPSQMASTTHRRAQTVISWLKWLMAIPDDDT